MAKKYQSGTYRAGTHKPARPRSSSSKKYSLFSRLPSRGSSKTKRRSSRRSTPQRKQGKRLHVIIPTIIAVVLVAALGSGYLLRDKILTVVVDQTITIDQIINGDMPTASIIEDSEGETIGRIFTQRRVKLSKVPQAAIQVMQKITPNPIDSWLEEYLPDPTGWMQKKVLEKLRSNASEQLTELSAIKNLLDFRYYGSGAYGLAEASTTFFGKPVTSLSQAELATLIIMSTNPEKYNPYENLSQVISAVKTQTNEDVPNTLLPAAESLPSGCFIEKFCDLVLEELSVEGKDKDTIATGGFIVKTTLNSELQRRAQRALAEKQADGVSSEVVVVSSDHKLRALAAQPQDSQSVTSGNPGIGSARNIFTIVTALKQGIGIDTPLSASGSPLSIKDRIDRGENFDSLMRELGEANVTRTAQNMGLEELSGTNLIDVANSLATLSAKGKACSLKTVQSVVDPNGNSLTPSQNCTQAINSEIANTTSFALSQSSRKPSHDRSTKRKGDLVGFVGNFDTPRGGVFLSYTDNDAIVVSIHSSDPQGSLCTSPLKVCARGKFSGANDPKHIATALLPPKSGWITAPTQTHMIGDVRAKQLALVEGKTDAAEVKRILTDNGYTVAGTREVRSSKPRGFVVGLSYGGKIPTKDTPIYIDVSNKAKKPPSSRKPTPKQPAQPAPPPYNPRPAPPPYNPRPAPRPPSGGGCYIDVPGVGRVPC